VRLFRHGSRIKPLNGENDEPLDSLGLIFRQSHLIRDLLFGRFVHARQWFLLDVLRTFRCSLFLSCYSMIRQLSSCHCDEVSWYVMMVQVSCLATRMPMSGGFEAFGMVWQLSLAWDRLDSMGFYHPNSTNLRPVAMSILAVSGREESSNVCEISLKASQESTLLMANCEAGHHTSCRQSYWSPCPSAVCRAQAVQVRLLKWLFDVVCIFEFLRATLTLLLLSRSVLITRQFAWK